MESPHCTSERTLNVVEVAGDVIAFDLSPPVGDFDHSGL